MADSFYGGKPGRDWVIKDTFGSIEDMVLAFQKGPEYTNAWFDEVVIIDTHNKNHPDNGKVYRRGLDYTNEMGGALYVGQIVGPRSGTPYMHLVTLEEAKKHSTEELGPWEYRQFPTGMGEDGKYKYSTDPGEEGKPIEIFEYSIEHDMSIVPGKTDEGEYNDGIKWTWVNIRKDDDEAGTVVYFGWEIPYLVMEFTSHQVSQYDEHGDRRTDDATTMTRKDDKSHPYYEWWDIGVPKGIKGDALRGLRVTIPTGEDRQKIYKVSEMHIDPDSGEVTMGTPGYDGIDEDIAGSRTILVYDLYYFDKKLNPDPITFYLGDWNQIDDIQLADDGSLTVGYTHDDNTVFERKIKWITDVTLAPDTGVFEVHYNNGDPMFTTTLDWIKDIVLDDDGTVHFWHTKDNRDDRHDNKVKWVKEVSLNADNGIFQMQFNYGPPLTVQLDWVKKIVLDSDGTIHYLHADILKNEDDENAIKWIDAVKLSQEDGKFIADYNYGDDYVSQLDWIQNITIDEETGDITFHHADKTLFNNGDELIDAKLKIVVAVKLNEDGVITFVYNTGEEKEAVTEDGQRFFLKDITDIKLLTGLEGDHRIQIKYNTEPEYIPIGDPINSIADVVVKKNNYHLLMLFNDPTHRATGDDLTEGVDENGNKWVNNVTGSNGEPTAANIFWRDFGAIKDQSGVLVGGNVSTDELNGQNIIDWLNKMYPTGHQDGKVFTYSDLDNENKSFYAFDYDTNEWYYLGQLQDSMRDAKIVELEDPSMDDIEDVNVKGLVFKASTITLSQKSLPKYWAPTYTGWES